MTADELIAALERADGPSRELDQAIVAYLHPEAQSHTPEGYHDPIAFHAESLVGQKTTLPSFTASVAAALTLTGGAAWCVEYVDGDNEFRASVWDGDRWQHGISSHIAAIAICIAALRARKEAACPNLATRPRAIFAVHRRVRDHRVENDAMKTLDEAMPECSKLAQSLHAVAVKATANRTAAPLRDDWNDFSAVVASRSPSLDTIPRAYVFDLRLRLGVRHVISEEVLSRMGDRAVTEASRRQTHRIVEAIFGEFRGDLRKAHMLAAGRGSREEVAAILSRVLTRMFGVP